MITSLYPSRMNEWVAEARRRTHPKALARNRPFLLTWRLIQTMRANDATHMAAGVAYYAVFSLFPLVMGMVSLTGFLLSSTEVQAKLLSYLTDNLHGSETFTSDHLGELAELWGALGIGAVIGLIWATNGLFSAINRAVNRAWHIPKERPFFIAKPRQLALALAVALLFLTSALATSVVEVLVHPGQDVNIASQGLFLGGGVAGAALRLTSFLASFSVFLLLYKFAPDCKTYWRYVWSGAAVAAVLFEGGKALFAWYLESVAHYTVVYGSVASVVVLLTWIYLSSMILILGAEVASEFSRSRLRRRARLMREQHAEVGGRNGVASNGVNGHGYGWAERLEREARAAEATDREPVSTQVRGE